MPSIAMTFSLYVSGWNACLVVKFVCVRDDATTTLMTHYGKSLENTKVMNWLSACRECLVVVATSSPSAPSKMKVEMHLK